MSLPITFLSDYGCADEFAGVCRAVAVRAADEGRLLADVPPGGLLAYEDSSGALALAVNRGDAAALLGIGAGDEVELRPA